MLSHHRRWLTASLAVFLAMAASAAPAAAASNKVPAKGYRFDENLYSTPSQVCQAYAKAAQGTATGKPEYADGSVRCRYKDSTGFESTTETVKIECPNDESNPSSLGECVCWNDKVASGDQCVAPDQARKQAQATPAPKAAVAPASAVPAATPGIVTPTPQIAARMRPEGALTDMANDIKKRGQQGGATVEIASARLKDGREILVAGINSGANGWTRAQRAQLQAWGVNIAPDSVPKAQLGKDDGGAIHAEENIAAYLDSIGARGERWSKAVVGKVKSGGSSYVCERCQSVIRAAGGHVEEPGAKAPPPPLDKPLRPPGK